MPLVNGAADELRSRGFAVFGPGAAAARIEGSKAFAKDVMAAAGVPTAGAVGVTSEAEIDDALTRCGAPYVVKDDGLAAGKGVVVTNDRAAAHAHAVAVLASGHPVLVEEYLAGPEVSLFAVCDGVTAVPLLPAQDFKRVGDGDTGPNTGGMGAYAPLPWAPAGLVDQVQRTVLDPVLAEMARRGTPFSGLLYAGLVLTAAGPKVIEFNCRFGDPETQVVLELLDTPLGALLAAAAAGELASVGPLAWRGAAAVTVVIAAENYPGPPVTGDVDHRGGRRRHPARRHGAWPPTDRWCRPAAGCCPWSPPAYDLAAARAAAYELVGTGSAAWIAPPDRHRRGRRGRPGPGPGNGLTVSDATLGPSRRSACRPVLRDARAGRRSPARRTWAARVQSGRRPALDAGPGPGAGCRACGP